MFFDLNNSREHIELKILEFKKKVLYINGPQNFHETVIVQRDSMYEIFR